MNTPLQVFNESSLIARTEETLLLQNPLFIGLVFGSMILVFILAVFPPKRVSWAGTASFVGAIGVFITLCVIGGAQFKPVMDTLNNESRSNISEKLNQKYGIEIISESDIPTTLANGSTTVGETPVPAKNLEGDRVQINIELVNNKTDVLAFCSGAEMKKINE